VIKKGKIILCAVILFSVFFVFCIVEGPELYYEATADFPVKNMPVKNMPAEIKALYKAYSSFIDEIKYVNDDWLITVRGVELFWAGGRLLPPEKKPYKYRYRSYGFYKYPYELPEIVREPDAQMLERLSRFLDGRRTLERDNTFLEILYNGRSLEEIQRHITRITFLGFRVKVHERIADRFLAIDREIRELALENPEVEQFISSLGSASAFMWRNIRGSRTRSLHSFGIAIDIIPRNIGNKQIYWRWTSVYNERWWSVPYSRRWMPPIEVIRIFEKYGFVWGGKWLAFDNMHFEYRPEILILAGREVAVPP